MTEDAARPRRAVITGGARGIGRAAAAGLARAGFEVLILDREVEAGEAAAASLRAEGGAARFVFGELSTAAGARAAASAIATEAGAIDALINNAGVLAERPTLTSDGVEVTLAVNFVAPVILSARLLPALRAGAPARVINVGSSAHRVGALDLGDPRGERAAGLAAYARSKLALLGFTGALARRLDPAEVTVNCVHPGVVGTGLGAGAGPISRLMGWSRRLLRSPEDGAGPLVWLASAPEVAGVSGRYFSRRRAVAGPGPEVEAGAWALAEVLAAEEVAALAALTGAREW